MRQTLPPPKKWGTDGGRRSLALWPQKKGIQVQGLNPQQLPSLGVGAEERTRTSTALRPPDPESGVSANSTTSARRQRESRGDLTEYQIQVKKRVRRGHAPFTCGAIYSYKLNFPRK